LLAAGNLLQNICLDGELGMHWFLQLESMSRRHRSLWMAPGMVRACTDVALHLRVKLEELKSLSFMISLMELPQSRHQFLGDAILVLCYFVDADDGCVP
jgi:hypothetical protein